MTGFLKFIGLLTVVLHCNGFSIREQADMLGDGLFNTAIPKSNSGPKKWIVLEIIPRRIQNPLLEMKKLMTKVSFVHPEEEEENNASEILDGFDNGDDIDTDHRRKMPSEGKFRADSDSDSEIDLGVSTASMSDEFSDVTSSTSSSSEISNEKHPQNLLWDKISEGRPMHLNPYGPILTELTAASKVVERPMFNFDHAENMLFINEVEGGREFS